MISLKKANTNFFYFVLLEEGPSLKFFFFPSSLVNPVVVVDACFTGEKKKERDLTVERGTNYGDARSSSSRQRLHPVFSAYFFFLKLLFK